MEKREAMPTIVECPTCNKPVEWSRTNPWRPFCSERCRLIDLGDWIEERNRIPDQANKPDFDAE
jgi:endogenous inhibitor of DNA gyrase (YacG/DUF329 family)